MATGSLTFRRSIDRPAYVYGCIILALLAVALLTRAGRIGDPTIHVDEQNYLLIADRMWHGALPYVDIWDRKPILLFLIYAALRPFSSDGIVAYQIGALLFATATAFVIVMIARRLAGSGGALLAGMAYLLYLPVLNGAGGQSPVFYNLFMAIAAWEVIRAGEAQDADGIWRHGARSMLWAGLAIQVKYTAAIDGVALGLWLIWLLMRCKCGYAHIAVRAAPWVALALAPTLLAAAFYVLIGHGREFFQANFLSIFQKQETDAHTALQFLRISGMHLAALLLITGFAIAVSIRRKRLAPPVGFIMLWTAMCGVDFFAIGGYYDHYALPLLVPATLLCAPLLDTAVGSAVGIGLFAWFSMLAIGFPPDRFRLFDQARVAAMVDAARPYVAHGCLYINDGPPIVYLLTHSCLPTRYTFPALLHDATEAQATHATRNMAKLLASRPSAIFVPDKGTLQPSNLVTAAMLNSVLLSDYRHVATLPDVDGERRQLLYVRRDLLPQQQDR